MYTRLGGLLDFNPRSPWGERPFRAEIGNIFLSISIHAPRGGSDDTTASV